MKKLLVLFGAMLAVVAAQAAMIDWSIEYAYAPGTEDDMEAGYYAYVFADSVTVDGASQTYGRSLAIAALEAGDTSFIKTYALNFGDAATFDGGEALQAGVGDFAAVNTVKAYAVILDAEDAADATKAYITEIASTSIAGNGAAKTIEFGDISDATGDVSNWISLSSDAAPEPTSGLLLMLGIAGLALKRKRA